jgi:hypothetical protein
MVGTTTEIRTTELAVTLSLGSTHAIAPQGGLPSLRRFSSTIYVRIRMPDSRYSPSPLAPGEQGYLHSETTLIGSGGPVLACNGWVPLVWWSFNPQSSCHPCRIHGKTLGQSPVDPNLGRTEAPPVATLPEFHSMWGFQRSDGDWSGSDTGWVRLPAGHHGRLGRLQPPGPDGARGCRPSAASRLPDTREGRVPRPLRHSPGERSSPTEAASGARRDRQPAHLPALAQRTGLMRGNAGGPSSAIN